MNGNKFSLLVGTLIHLHRKYHMQGEDTSQLELAIAASQVIQDEVLTPAITEEMTAIADTFFELEKPKPPMSH